jgi:hypothetical protein
MRAMTVARRDGPGCAGSRPAANGMAGVPAAGAVAGARSKKLINVRSLSAQGNKRSAGGSRAGCG